MTVLSSEEEIQRLQDERIRSSISVLKAPKFWQSKNNSRANSAKGGTNGQKCVQQWAHVYDSECNAENGCKDECKRGRHCKLFVMKIDEGLVKIKKLCNNARMPVRGTEGSAGYDLAAAQIAVVPAHGKMLVKTGLSMSLPAGCYGRIAPRSGLALKKFIDVGAGVIDADYRGEVGVILFNFGDTDFEVKMGDKIAQLIFEKIKTPVVIEVDCLEETERGEKGYGSTGIETKPSFSQSSESSSKPSTVQSHSVNQCQSSEQQFSSQRSDTGQTNKHMKQYKNDPILHSLNNSKASKTRQIITARQIQKLAKQDQPVFLAIIRPTN